MGRNTNPEVLEYIAKVNQGNIPLLERESRTPDFAGVGRPTKLMILESYVSVDAEGLACTVKDVEDPQQNIEFTPTTTEYAVVIGRRVFPGTAEETAAHLLENGCCFSYGDNTLRAEKESGERLLLKYRPLNADERDKLNEAIRRKIFRRHAN